MNCHAVVKVYLQFIAENFITEPYGENGCRIYSPYWRPDGDFIEFFAFADSNGSLILSDEGQTLDWLSSVGLEVKAKSARSELIDELLERYQAQQDKGIIRAVGGVDTLGQDIDRFLALLRSIGNLIVDRKPHVSATFRDEVENFLLAEDQVFTPKFKIRGLTVEHRIDFLLDSGRNILIQAVTATSTSSARQILPTVLFRWIDIRAAQPQFGLITLLDDTDNKWEQIWQQNAIGVPLNQYSDQIIRWSQKETLLLTGNRP